MQLFLRKFGMEMFTNVEYELSLDPLVLHLGLNEFISIFVSHITFVIFYLSNIVLCLIYVYCCIYKVD